MIHVPVHTHSEYSQLDYTLLPRTPTPTKGRQVTWKDKLIGLVIITTPLWMIVFAMALRAVAA